MQLKRVYNMSYPTSPYSGLLDEYDFDDEGYKDDYKNYEEDAYGPMQDDSDEDTEEASETDIANSDDPELKVQMYKNKLAHLRWQLEELEAGELPAYKKKMKLLEYDYKIRLCCNKMYREHMLEVVRREYSVERKAAGKEFEEKKIELKETLLSDFEEKRRIIEAERHSMELNGDSMEVKPVMKRILRRRANEPAPVPEKRRKPLATTLTLQLDERDVEADLRAIARHTPPPRHHQPHPHPNPHSHPHAHQQPHSHQQPHAHTASPRKRLNSNCESPVPDGGGGGGGGGGAAEHPGAADTRVEDGKLLYERRWFCRGQSVYVEGRDVPRFPGHIQSITDESIWVKKQNLEKYRIYVTQLARGKVTLKRRAS